MCAPALLTRLSRLSREAGLVISAALSTDPVASSSRINLPVHAYAIRRNVIGPTVCTMNTTVIITCTSLTLVLRSDNTQRIIET